MDQRVTPAKPETKPANVTELFPGQAEREPVEWQDKPKPPKRLRWEVRSYDRTGALGRFVMSTWRWRWLAHWDCFWQGGGEDERDLVFYVAKEGDTWP